MKIALCYSGQTRSVETGLEYMNKALEGYDVTRFIHTWDTSNNYSAPFSIQEKPFNSDYINSKYTNIDNPAYPAINTYSMFYSIFASNFLKRKAESILGFKFDVVIRTRFDFCPNKILDFSDVVPGKIYVPDCRFDIHHRFCSDQFAYGTSETMDLYCNTFTNIDLLYQKGVVMNGEHMLSANLQAYGLVGENMVYKNWNPPFPPSRFDGNPSYICRDDFDKFKAPGR